MIRLRWALWIAVALAAALFALFALQLSRPRNDLIHSAMIGKKVPPFELQAAVPDRPGLSSLNLEDGQPKLLNIFASWCIPCIAEAPFLARLQSEGAQIVGIALRDRPQDVAVFLANHGNPFTRIGADNLSQVPLSVGSSGVPETFVINGEGVIVYQHIGDIREGDIPFLLSKLREAEQ